MSFSSILLCFIILFLVIFVLYNLTNSLVVFHLYKELWHTHKQEMELPTCDHTSSYFYHFFIDPCWGRTYFLLSEIISFNIILFHFMLFCFYLFCFILFYSYFILLYFFWFCYFILFYFILFNFILDYFFFIFCSLFLFYFILFCF